MDTRAKIRERLQWPQFGVAQVVREAERQDDPKSGDAEDRRKQTAEKTIAQRRRFGGLDPRCLVGRVSLAKSSTARHPFSRGHAELRVVAPVVAPRRHTGETRHGELQSPEQVDGFERAVAPTRRDAIVPIVWAPMVRRVFSATQKQAARLQDADRQWRERHV